MVVSEATDSVGFMEFVRGLHEPKVGWVVCELFASRSMIGPSRAVLAALGKRTGTWAEKESVGRARAQACAWLRGELITDLIVLRAHRHPNQTPLLIELGLHAGTRIWLIDNQRIIPEAHQEALRAYPSEGLSAGGFRSRWNRRPAKAPVRPTPAQREPPLPDCQFPHFLGASRRLLSAEGFLRVKQEYQQALHYCRAAARELPRERWNQGAEALTKRLIAELPRRAGTERKAQINALACQQAFFERGWFLRIEPREVAAAQLARPSLDVRAAERLRIYDSPRYAALAVTVAVCSLGLNAANRIRTREVAADGSRIQDRSVPEHLRAFVRAQRIYRLLFGADEDSRFLASPQGANPKALGAMLRRIALETGVMVKPYWSDHSAGDGARASLHGQARWIGP